MIEGDVVDRVKGEELEKYLLHHIRKNIADIIATGGNPVDMIEFLEKNLIPLMDEEYERKIEELNKWYEEERRKIEQIDNLLTKQQHMEELDYLYAMEKYGLIVELMYRKGLTGFFETYEVVALKKEDENEQKE